MLLSRGTRKNLLLEIDTEIQTRDTFAVCGCHLLLLFVTVANMFKRNKRNTENRKDFCTFIEILI